jgi:hypothetical protein
VWILGCKGVGYSEKAVELVNDLLVENQKVQMWFFD